MVDGKTYAIGGSSTGRAPVSAVEAFTPGEGSTSVESLSWGSIKARTRH